MKCRQPLHIADIFIETGISPEKPGIYMWELNGVIRYVGKYKRKNRPLHEYARNVERIALGKSYHIEGRNFRRVHYALHKAVLEKENIRLIFFENIDDNSLRLIRESELIKKFKSEGKADLND